MADSSDDDVNVNLLPRAGKSQDSSHDIIRVGHSFAASLIATDIAAATTVTTIVHCTIDGPNPWFGKDSTRGYTDG
jgi:hypothetical protein